MIHVLKTHDINITNKLYMICENVLRRGITLHYMF
jgi:hypothetical protein